MTILENALHKLPSNLFIWNRHRTTDVYMLGYPKSGNTWIKFLLGRYLQLICSSIEMVFFDGYDHFGRCQKACVGPSIYHTHSPLVWTYQTAKDLTYHNTVKPFQSRKVVLIVRYPLDALVSSYFQAVLQTNEFSGELSQFLEHKVWGLEKWIRFYNLWAHHRQNVKDVLLLRYEDLRSDTEISFKHLLKFLVIDIKEQQTNEAIYYASFENMKTLEKKGDIPRYRSSGLKVFATGDINNPESYHVRKGKVGGYKDYLSLSEIEKYEARIAQELDPWYEYTNSLGK